jgi:hypothetical protein
VYGVALLRVAYARRLSLGLKIRDWWVTCQGE